MSALTNGIYIVAAKRTPFCAFGGKFVKKSACESQTEVAKATLSIGSVSSNMIDSVIIGNVMGFTSKDSAYLSRHVLLKSGIPLDRPAYSVNRMCGSGFQSIVNAAQNILTGESNIVLTGGVENMSQVPFLIRNVRFGNTLGTSINFEDSLMTALFDTYCDMSMVSTVEKLAQKYGIQREESDYHTISAKELWIEANESGIFKEEICPIEVDMKSKKILVATDDNPKIQNTIEMLQNFKPVVKGGKVVTSGSASGFSDGAGAVIVASEKAVKVHNLEPLARLVGYCIVGVEPSLMGLGPVPAIQKLLKVTQKTLDEIDIIEINEVFSAQALACAKELNLNPKRMNENGGSLAIGNPFGAVGSRLVAHIVHQLRRKNVKFGIGSACLGGGQGMALMFERV